MLKEYFTNYHRFQFVVSLPSTWSGLLLFNQLAADGSGAVERKLVIKFALNWQLDPIVANELNYLRALRGSEHVVQIVSLRGVPGGGASAEFAVDDLEAVQVELVAGAVGATRGLVH
ncbi:hypothetical protein UCREL1_4226 [Eutypa lata UCREL1]|uniref:Uncharacterized protein n=1 Tax=Eutypa lata (strain UCR-EL1) TaxID=1287681 RepID=M7TFN3_EUTLA|nr:hypothetical protein UCREL1_4226 [Eutypa lata UCREL1]